LHLVDNLIEIHHPLFHRQLKILLGPACHHLLHGPPRDTPPGLSVDIPELIGAQIFANLLRLLLAQIRRRRPPVAHQPDNQHSHDSNNCQRT
jgi:hypothetical protein